MINLGKIKNGGFSLIEMITVLTVIALVFMMLLFGLFFSNTINTKARINQEIFNEERFLNLYFQKQILESRRIIVKSDRLYLQDLETPNYYNYYIMSNGMIKRYKVYETNLSTIGTGASSQLADNIKNFSISLDPAAAAVIILKYTLSYEGETYEREITIEHGKIVEYP
ncbi:prepilin-type N-terminal cleavage/methylation domain-containing protein [Acetobacterium bakii]|uniref:Prepilin-type N-terminal cleavage/methylation domain-containing protein n=1 Tax=Acetobacterium bakii TaxID=52689 RepID=A0A0L6U0V6_9FIRM|nr:prepilin-type N-terminal cleavage/methylation domain-containing protein [Acetobacterium bakii]KNZ41430.1 hypothetical protein AKG39_12510 [Acetobacterium bakii]